MTLDALSAHTETVPPAAALEEAAQRLIAQHADALPDLSGLIVLLPSLHAVAPFARALAQAAGRSTLILPRLTTLPQLAAQMPLLQPTTSELERQGLLYGALRERGWLREQDRWSMARALMSLFDELTLHRVALPEDEADFARRLAAAYGAREGPSLRFEARLVHSLWQVHNAVLADRPDATAAYVLRLSRLAREAPAPLYAVGLGQLAPVEVECLLRYAERQPVRVFAPALLEASKDPVQEVLAAAWMAGPDTLGERALRLRERHPASPLANRLRLSAAHGLEQAAQLAEHKLRRWLAEGRQSIAIVAQDRLAARRLRALLERCDILVSDETGWTLSTAAAASVVMRWLDLMASDFHHRELLDFLKSPLIFSDVPAPARREAVYELERLIRSRNLVSRLAHYRIAARETGSTSLALLDRLEAARRLWPREAKPLADWFATLRQTLDGLGITQALRADLAGAQLFALLATLEEDAQKTPGRFHLAEWRRLLDEALEATTFRDASIDSPVVFTHLAATRLRRFDGVILLGAGAEELPSRPEGSPFFNEAVRAELMLPTRRQTLESQRKDLAGLLSGANEVLAIWQSEKDGETHLPSPWFDVLATLHEMAWGDDLALREELRPISPPRSGATPRPAPRLAPAQVPTRISASGYNSLLACPYQYFARHVLGLNEEDEVTVEMEKQDFGQVVHRILARFHARHPVITRLGEEEAERILRAITEEVFAPLLAQNYLNHAWKLAWEAVLPDYLAWQRSREQNDWRVAGQEIARRRRLALDDGTAVELVGTLDRLDRADDRLAVLDYKTGDPSRLRKRLKDAGEDVQLPVYALLAGEQVAEAAYIVLAKEGPTLVPFARDIASEAALVEARLVNILGNLRAGAPLPAHGREESCRHCEMAGLCRRAFWETLP
ncbi:PD-(D/E)XK nuclease family protein [Thiobacter aerophilum]|uniref:PD-(D/E)XK nuclease family protein n=1 Tax=Thiobacter aerophilum TaxID=3121275 RepID=A0ABV0EI39_9BURK